MKNRTSRSLLVWAVLLVAAIVASCAQAKTVTRQSVSPASPSQSTSFSSPTPTYEAWAVGAKGTILATSGGVHWRAQPSGTHVVLDGVAFADAAHGWVVGDNGTILATTDGGLTWSKQQVATRVLLGGVACSDTSHAWVVGMQGTILATTDGGAHWHAQTSGVRGVLTSVAFADAKHGWAVTLGGKYPRHRRRWRSLAPAEGRGRACCPSLCAGL